MKRSNMLVLAAVSALALGAAGPVFAADAGAQAPKPVTPAAPDSKMAPAGKTQAQSKRVPDWIAAAGTPSQKLVGAEVVNTENESIGDVENVVAVNGRQKLIVSVGKFLGLGGRNVAIDLDKTRIMRSTRAENEYRVVTGMSEDEIKSLPEYGK